LSEVSSNGEDKAGRRGEPGDELEGESGGENCDGLARMASILAQGNERGKVGSIEASRAERKPGRWALSEALAQR